MFKMKDEYKNTLIYKVCKELDIDIKELAFSMNKTHKTIENWRKDENSIPSIEKRYLKLLVRGKQLEEEIIRLQKHKIILRDTIKSDLKGNCEYIIKATGLKKLVSYKIVLEEI